MFKPGQKLVNHIAFGGKLADGRPSLSPQPILYNVYTFDGYNYGGGIYLKEFSDISPNGWRPHYAAYKFRPLDEVLSEISIKELLEEPVTV